MTVMASTGMPGETHMDGIALRAMQAPIKERYKSQPEAALVTL